MPDRHGKYSYFDTPDGQDGHKKAWYISKNLTKIGVITATIDAFNISQPQTKLGVLAVYGKHIGVLVGAGLTFACTTLICTDLRKKDDANNHVVAAVATSAVFGACAASPWVFGTLALVSMPLAHINKTAVMEGVNPWNFHRETGIKREHYINWHNFELDRRPDTLQKAYDEKNEEYFRQRKDSEV